MTTAVAQKAQGVGMPKKEVTQSRIDKEIFRQIRIRALQEGYNSAEAWIDVTLREALQKPAKKGKK